jgi:ABC-type phosphate transport system auxiliary subunit
MNEEIINSLLKRADEMLNREIGAEEIITIIKEYKKLQDENKELKEEIDNLIKENHKHIDYIADMKKKFKQRIRNLVQEYKPNQSNTFIESQERYIELVKKLELLGE